MSIGWAEIIKLIIATGIPAADAIITKWLSGSDPTLADWQGIMTMASQTKLTQMQDALARAGIPLDDPRAVAFLALVK